MICSDCKNYTAVLNVKLISITLSILNVFNVKSLNFDHFIPAKAATSQTVPDLSQKSPQEMFLVTGFSDKISHSGEGIRVML